MLSRLACCLAVALTTACTDKPERCAQGLGQPMLVFDLFFGRAVAGRGDVTDQEWTAFVEDTVTPALPNGFTVLDARGSWFSPRSQRTTHEATKVILVALPHTSDSLDAINRVRSAYQTRFRQQLVGMTAQPTCGTF